MEKQNLVLGFKDQEASFTFENKVSLVQDKKLNENLSKPNIKNQDSSLLIKSMNDTHISDVIQIKVNVAETGHFLVSFNKETLTEELRNKLLEEIGSLKSNETPTLETQNKKIKDLLDILSKYEPIYASFANAGDIKIELSALEEMSVSFPVLVLEQPVKKLIKIGKTRKEKVTKDKPEVHYEPFALFDVDYVFAFIFSLLGAFAITASVFELMNKEGIAAFLIVLGIVFAITLVIAVHSTVYKKTEVRNPWLRYYLVIFILLGIAGGIVAGYFICKGVLKTEIEDFDYKKMMAFAIPISIVAMLSSVESCRLVNLIFKLRQKKKSQ